MLKIITNLRWGHEYFSSRFNFLLMDSIQIFTTTIRKSSARRFFKKYPYKNTWPQADAL